MRSISDTGSTMSEEHRAKDRDMVLATMYRLDPVRLRQLRRAMSGITRCPACDAANPPESRLCNKCGEKLYPVEEAEERLFRRKRDSEDEEHAV